MERKRLTSKIATDILYASNKVAAKGEGDRDLEGVGPYDPSKLEHIKSLLHGLSVALGTLNASQRELTTLKGHEISPDGKLGGKGYVMTLRKFKDLIADSVNNLSDLTDTLADELTNPRWGLSTEEVQAILDDKNEAEEQASEKADLFFQESEQRAEELAEEGEQIVEESEDGEDKQVAEEKPEEKPEEDSSEGVSEETLKSLGESPEEPGVVPEEDEESQEESDESEDDEDEDDDEEGIAKESRGDAFADLIKSLKSPKNKKASSEKMFLSRKSNDPVARALSSKILSNLVKKAGE